MESQHKDIWDKISASSGMIAAILVPVAVAFVGAQYSASLKQQELEATSRREYINIALTILRDPGTDDSLREWGTKIINHYADVEMPTATKAAFNKGGQILPSANQIVPVPEVVTTIVPPTSIPLAPGGLAVIPGSTDSPSSSAESSPRLATVLTSTQRLSKIDFWQTQGIKALLDRDLEQAVKAYGNAYALWPEFRNVDEIQRLLKSLHPSPKNEQEWNNLYQKIAKYDL